MIRSRFSALVSLAFLPLTALLALSSDADAQTAFVSDRSVSNPSVEEPAGLARLGAWFEAHPELKETKSSGWKPYNRELWLQETRRAPEGVSVAKLRGDIFQAARLQIEQRGGSGQGWFTIGPTEFSGRCLTVDFHPTDPDIVYVGTAGGGLWKTIDGGDTWSTSTDDLPTLAVGAVCVLAWDPDIVLMGTGEGTGVGYVPAGKGMFGNGLLKSTDGGGTWSPTSLDYSIPSNHGFSVIEDNPATGTILAGASDGLWRSTDDGDTWTEVLPTGNFFDVKWKPGSANTVYVTKGRDPFANFQSDNGVFISNDDGLTFTLAGTGQPTGSNIAKTKIAVTAANPNYIYAHYISSASYGTIGIYRSTNGGATWQVRTNSVNMGGGQGWYNNVIAVDPNNSERVVAGGNILYVSSNGGTTFTQLNQSIPFGDDIAPHWDNHALAYEPGSNSTLWIATDGGPWRSTDDGSIWTSRRAGIISYQFYDIGVAQSDPIFIMGGTQDNGIPGRTDEDTWFQSTFVADGFVCNIDPVNADIVYSEWQGGNHLKSTDRGQSWVSIQNGIFGSGAWLTPVDQDQSDGGHLYTSTSSGIFRTSNGGSNWTQVSTHGARWISMNQNDGDTIWTVSNTQGVWHSADDGANWTQSATFPATGLEVKIQADPSDPAAAFVVHGGYATGGPHISRTTDFGLTWVDVTGDFPDQPANTFIVDGDNPTDWYVGADVGVWKSSNGGVNWTPFGYGLINAVVADLEIRRTARKLVAGTYGRGAWEANLDLDPTAADPGELVARDLMLDPPHPNPATDHAIFRFASRAPGPVSLDVFDIAGRRVDSVFEGGAGDGVIRTVSWSAGDLPGGIYLVRLRAGDQESTRKLLLRR